MSNIRVERIVVRKSTCDSDGVVQAVVDYVNDLRNFGCYETAELPSAALGSYYVDFYMDQVGNYGHGQFHPSKSDIRHIREGLAGIKLEPFVTIFREFEVFLAERAAQTQEVNEVRESALNRFDQTNWRETLLPANARWISSSPALRLVSDTEYVTEVERLARANPLRLQRRRMQLRKENQWRLGEAYVVAAGILSYKRGISPRSLQMNWHDTSWSHSADKNLRGVDGIALQDTGTRMFLEANDYVLREGDLNGPILERAPTSLVDGAITAAKKYPVVEAAEFAVPKVSGDAESVVNIVECGGKKRRRCLDLDRIFRRVALPIDALG